MREEGVERVRMLQATRRVSIVRQSRPCQQGVRIAMGDGEACVFKLQRMCVVEGGKPRIGQSGRESRAGNLSVAWANWVGMEGSSSQLALAQKCGVAASRCCVCRPPTGLAPWQGEYRV